MEDIARYRASYIDILVQENLIGSRFKSDDSIMRKYEKTLKNKGGFKQCFNDILGFRLRFDEYRAIHLYYQKGNLAYPIEIQLWCGKDYLFNIWSHQYVYKYKKAQIGQKLYKEYKNNAIVTEQDFLKQLEYWEGEMNGR